MGSDHTKLDIPRKVLFLTGTRADFGKLKPLIRLVDKMVGFDCTVFVTGMHTLELYGLTVTEVEQENFKSTHVYHNQYQGEPMEQVMANTINGLSRFVRQDRPDMLIVHGDRVEALAGAVVGSLCNILVGHIEGGERSGTIDESIRHAVSKLSHIHFVANKESARRLCQLGEDDKSIFIIGSPEIDIMTSENLPTINENKIHYQVKFDEYAIALFHPVTTDVAKMAHHAKCFVDALINSGHNYLVIYPNNDNGNHDILREYERFKSLSKFRVIPSIRFENFLVFMKNCQYIVGNSSAGIREAPFYLIPTINVGSRQNNRSHNEAIINVAYDKNSILNGILKVKSASIKTKKKFFGEGNSAKKFISVLERAKTWQTANQKQFFDLPY